MYGRVALFRAVLLAGVGLAITGCGSSGPTRYPVEGTVTYNGQPLPDGHISLFAVDGQAAPDAGPISQGKFKIMSTPGKKRVEIKASRDKAGAPTAAAKAMGALTEREQYIQARYNDKSELTIEVKTEKNEAQWEVGDKDVKKT